jgi:hypothetical protein
VHFGPVLSGEKIVADSGALAAHRKAWPKARGVEMEGLGTAVAHHGDTRFVLIKAVSDLADRAKDDRWHGYAAEAAARFAVEVIPPHRAAHQPDQHQRPRAPAPHRLPRRGRMMRLLEDAHRRGVLRKAGPVYQFRHARLQARLSLAESADAKSTVLPSPAVPLARQSRA